jgi:hypothetical protein
MPRKDVEAILKNISGWKALKMPRGHFSVPCLTILHLELTFKDKDTFKTTIFAIDPKDLVLAPLKNNEPNDDCDFGIVADDAAVKDPWTVRVW